MDTCEVATGVVACRATSFRTRTSSLMREHGISAIWSHDGDLRKFGGVTVKDPFSEEHSTEFE
jgi:hypothetical protein